jgi:phosphatidate cytidylyltransferase
MTDDIWRRDRDEDPAEHEPTGSMDQLGDSLSFGASDTGSLPHWTEPPTGEVPRLQGRAQATEDDELDVWSSFTSESPVWREDVPAAADASGEIPAHRTGPNEPVTGRTEAVPPREPSRITIGTDPSGMPRRPPVQTAAPPVRCNARAGATCRRPWVWAC